MTMKNPPHPGLSVRHDCLEPLGLTITEAAEPLGVTRHTKPTSTSSRCPAVSCTNRTRDGAGVLAARSRSLSYHRLVRGPRSGGSSPSPTRIGLWPMSE
jgi:hypothetical protein